MKVLFCRTTSTAFPHLTSRTESASSSDARFYVGELLRAFRAGEGSDRNCYEMYGAICPGADQGT